VLNPRWSTAKADTAGLGALMKTRQQMNELGYSRRLRRRCCTSDDGWGTRIFRICGERFQQGSGRAWKDLDANAHSLAKRLTVRKRRRPRDVAIAVVGASGDDSVFGDHGEAAGGGAEDQEFFTSAQVKQKLPLRR